MVNTSRAYREAVASGRRDWIERVTITLTDNTVLNITNAQIWSNGLSIEDAVSGDNSFDALGATVINKATIVLNNITDEFSAYDFDKATVWVQVGLQLTQYIVMFDRGYYTVAEPKYDGSLITLECYDYMAKFDRPYSESTLAYPATLLQIVSNACTACGVTLGTTTFPNATMQIPTKPETDALTFREVIGWCAQIAGCFARMSGDGRLELKWFNGDVVDQESENALDGGVFDSGTPQYSTGDSADGGSFNPWNTGDEYDSGTFSDQSNYHVISAVYNPNVATDDTVITGVKIEVKTSSESETALAEYTYGTEGYTIGISDNDFITELNAQSIANFLGQRLVGLRFRKATVSHGSDPSIEAGDVALLRTAKGLYVMLITRTVFSSSAAQTTVCASETVARNSATRFTEATKNYVKLREQIVVERSAREQAVAELAEALAESSGLYNTTISAGQVDPSTGQVVTSGNIFFLHDRPLLAESSVVWKMTSDAFGVTNDYQGTSTVWTAGLTVDGNLIANILSAVGVNADWINTGALSIKDLDDNETFYANADTGEVRILALSELAKAGTNIMRNTLVPTSAALPKIGATGITSGSDLHVLSIYHGIGTTTAGAGYAPYLYFDSTSTLLATGGTYTFSFNYEAYLLYSATPATEDYNFVVRFYKGDTLVKEDVIETMHAGDSDCDLLGFYAFTFTVPRDVSGSRRRISITVSPNEGASLGPDDFFELTNLMLIKGDVAAPWSAAPEDLDQTTVFNKLTNDGALQGLFMENGQLYINMSYLKSGTIIVGGTDNQNGVLEIRNSSDTRIGRWDKDALYIGNVSSALTAPNTKIDTNGAITTKSLTANDYVYVDGNTSSRLFIPATTAAASRNNYYVDINNKGLTCRYNTLAVGIRSANLNAPIVVGNPSDVTSDKANPTNPNARYGNQGLDYRYGNSANPVRSTMLSNGSLVFKAGVNVDGNTMGTYGQHCSVSGNLTVSGVKNRLVSTKSYGDRYLSCYETPTPMFGDVGEGKIGEDGKCYVQIDAIFSETVSLSQYQVFLQKYGEGDCWVSGRNGTHFVVEGTAGLSFGWELKAKQADFSQMRMTKAMRDPADGDSYMTISDNDYANDLLNHILSISGEREVLPA